MFGRHSFIQRPLLSTYCMPSTAQSSQHKAAGVIPGVARGTEEHEQLQEDSRSRRDKTHGFVELEAEGKGMGELGHPGDRVGKKRQAEQKQDRGPWDSS